MKTLPYIITLTIFTLAVLILPIMSGLASSGTEIVSIAHAQDSYRFLAPVGGLGEEVDVSSENSFGNYVKSIFTIVIGFAIMAAIIVIIAAGFQYMTSTSQGGVSQAKKSISNAILGLVLALASVLILQTINPNLIGLHAVDTVTTSGSMFETDFDGEPIDVTPPGGGEECEPDDSDCYEGRQCIEMVDPGWFWDSTLGYYCYENSGECNTNRGKLIDNMVNSLMERGWSEDDSIDEVSDIVGSCDER